MSLKLASFADGSFPHTCCLDLDNPKGFKPCIMKNSAVARFACNNILAAQCMNLNCMGYSVI